MWNAVTDCPDDKSDLFDIDALIKAGELLAAYDKARTFLKSQPHSLSMRHRAVLCLARAGALEQAQKEYNRLGLDAITDNEDILALGGRVLKAIALEETGTQRHRLAMASADKYAQAYQKTGGYFTGINTATMSLIAGNKDRAMTMAGKVLASLPNVNDARAETTYYQEATRAEALLLLGLREEAKGHLATSIACDPKNYSARAGTLAQLKLIENALDQNPQWLDAFRPPNAMHFTGHMFDARHDKGPHNENAIIERVTRLIHEEKIGFGFGALAAGADIIIAETLLALGKELHLVQPAPDDAFIQASLIPFGPDWHDRFQFCKKRAATISYVNDGRLIPMALTWPSPAELQWGMLSSGREPLAASPFSSQFGMGNRSIFRRGPHMMLPAGNRPDVGKSSIPSRECAMLPSIIGSTQPNRHALRSNAI
ncbi:hypothetical protein JCM17844_30040 [Iodidimonas gelatinilytica]|uniref:Tetratricopeptide repeat protein n=1 Tax=Iodidimonas gelatinilytica TaxID=1236966 RepID=A0A5A7MTU3_9PROT|nr:tetratricopeptide repeat-containing protein [Iodidimonas gelatinilytica]GEQ99367.1 hypothetical protein JCM17844_30040 [Iodidimonas gelatinilytica]